MGSIFKIPVVQNINLYETAELLHKNGIKLYAAHLKGRKNHYEEDYTGGCAFLLGNEARGLSEHAASLCDELIKIPMPGGAESLNASVAAAVLMYEAVRQKMLR
ncbi:tRNA (guanosine(18)-2'-O)-methyltransferase [bioreactor metagenome]|uniref:tRNA (Guanosine(18)-2'-O)-methyltransferase n=1 Tax=bioreactor metagenome TaxID=1076179 RepID=A0A645ACM2_9ZZZZ